MNSFRAIILLAVCLALRCSNPPVDVAGGSTIETTNGAIAAVVTGINGGPAVNVTVRLRPAGYLAAEPRGFAKQSRAVMDLQTDQSGRFVIDSVEYGKYVIEATNERTGAVSVSCELVPGMDTLDLQILGIKPFAALSGRIRPDSLSASGAVAKIYGLERAVSVDPATGSYSFDDLPEGEHTIRLVPAHPDLGAAVVEVNPVPAGGSDTVPAVTLARFGDEAYRQWPHASALRINTTAAGANVMDDVYEFPFLVRLNTSFFRFSEASADGRDIRFSRSNGMKLRHEIEQWDSAAGYAAVWVLVDTIFGNDSTQTITMHWGREDAPDFSNGAAVFGRSRGYAGVWHMAGNARDATGNANHGIVRGPFFREGGVGEAAWFGKRDDNIEIPDDRSLDLGSGDFAISLSIYAASFDTVDQILRKMDMKKKQGQYEIQLYKGEPGGWMRDSATLVSRTFGGGKMALRTWHHIAVVRRGDSLHVYLDGVRSGGRILKDMNTNNTGAIGIGRDPYNFKEPLDGALDEIRIVTIARSPAWIRLSWENQRRDSRVVEWVQ